MLLISLLLSPIISIIMIMLLPSSSSKRLGLLSSILTLWISLFLWVSLDESGIHLVISNNYNYPIDLSVDGLSILFILLTTFIIPVAILSNWSNLREDQLSIKYYIVLILLIELLLLLVFTVTDILLFYIFFEAILPPLFLLKGLYGSQ